MTTQRASNRWYFKAWNEDYRQGGVFWGLKPASLRTIIVLQAYASDLGMVYKSDSHGYSISELANMVGVSYNTLDKSLKELSDCGLISIDDDMRICVTTFLTDMTARDISDGKERAEKRNRAIQQSIATKRAKHHLDNAVLEGQRHTMEKVLNLDSRVKNLEKAGD